ncbi:hypothetical protein NEMIN01_0421 [Nematocida minor]|uniref:uncharacterized protein n=1 Tax=Nematocida minor TaxID=1912983 RepID=UPI00221F3A15|nr:uncharacterized protein NEMIN01_0421 [Nematocida minor]KAI5189358.1 hypothetical protein NEMIN01_0421 [Nematocida minor]
MFINSWHKHGMETRQGESEEKSRTVKDDLKILLAVTLLFVLNYIFAVYVEIKPYQERIS